MNDRVSRRGALRQLLRETVRGAEAVGREVVPNLSLEEPTRPEPVGKRPKRPEPADPGPPPTAVVSTDELLDWAEEAGLGEHADAIRRAARLSFRASDGGTSGRSKFWGRPDLAPGVERPMRRGLPLDFVAQFDLGEVVDAGDASDLPGRGSLAIFHSHKAVVRMARGEVDHCRVIWRDADGPLAPGDEAEPPSDGIPFRLAPELLLPRVWSSGPRALDLGPGQRNAWERLRQKLARAQGVEPFDSAPGLLAIDRLLGYPDERTGDMPLICELLDNDVDLGGRPVRTHPEAKRLEPASHRWTLLLQLSRSQATRQALRSNRDRLYLWIPEADLRAGDFSNVRAIQR